MKKHYKWKYLRKLINGEKISRKSKKAILGKKISHSKLIRLLKSVEIGKPAQTMYEQADIKPFLFCPNCGCKETKATGNMTEYPEHWENFYCLRCENLVASIDNSPFIHALECENYEIY